MNQIKHRLANAVLYEYEDGLSLRHALEKATEERANLSGANLSGANLEGANLGGGAKLIGARPIFQIGPIGSRLDTLVAYITDQGLRIDAGCQRQITREVFESMLTETHGDNEYAKEYRAALALVDVHAEVWGVA